MIISDAIHLDLFTVIASINKFVEDAILRYKGADKLTSDVEALELYNTVLIRPGQNYYDVSTDDWEDLEEFDRGDSTPIVTLDDTEKEVISMSLIKKSFIQTVGRHGIETGPHQFQQSVLYIKSH